MKLGDSTSLLIKDNCGVTIWSLVSYSVKTSVNQKIWQMILQQRRLVFSSISMSICV